MLLAWQVKRGVVYLKRIAESAHRQAEAAETLARIETDRWEREYAPRPKGKFVVGSLDQKAANERWHKLQEMERTGSDE